MPNDRGPASRAEALDLLNSTHDFPTCVPFKVIGNNVTGLAARVVTCIRDVLQLREDPHFYTRTTPGRRHIAVTVEPEIERAEQVLIVYQRLRQLEDVVMLM